MAEIETDHRGTGRRTRDESIARRTPGRTGLARRLQRAPPSTPSLRTRLAALVLLVAALAGGVYFTQIQPGGLRPAPPAVTARLEEEAARPVFAYGTLTSGFVRFAVTLGRQDARPARLPGYRREGRNILARDGASVDGILFEVTPRELRRLDLYERLGERYERIEVELADGTIAWAYRAL